MNQTLTATLAALLAAAAASARTVTIASPDFDFVQRVNYGRSSVFEADAGNFSVYAVGDDNSAQQTWFRVHDAVTRAAAGTKIRSARLVFGPGTEDHAARTLFLARTTAPVTAAVNRRTLDGSTPYPSPPGSKDSFSPGGYLAEPKTLTLSATGTGEIDVTDWLTTHPGATWLLTASPAARGAKVTSPGGSNWQARWHWPNRKDAQGNSPVQLVLDLALPDNSPPVVTTQLPGRSAQYAGEPLTLRIEAATGRAPLTYQWQKDGKPIPGATSPALTIPSLTTQHAGRYQVAVSNRHGRLLGNPCELTVLPVPDLASFTPPPDETTRYHALNQAVIGINQKRFFNRPHYSNNTNAFILTGDKPMVKFASGGTVHGHFWVGVKRGNSAKWLHDFTTLKTAFLPAHTTWLASDPAFAGLSVRLQVLTLAGTTGFAARVSASGTHPNDQLVWAYAGASKPGGNLNWSIDPYPVGEARLLGQPFAPNSARGNLATIHSDTLAGSFSLAPAGGGPITFGRVTTGRVTTGRLATTEATTWKNPAAWPGSPPAECPAIAGSLPLSAQQPTHWSFTRTNEAPATLDTTTDPSTLFLAGLARSADFASRLHIETPDPRVNAAAAMAVAGIDGMWYGNKFVHGSMSWNSPYLGWRTTIGGTMLGWHDRVKASVDTYLAAQITESKHTSGEAMGRHGGRDYLLTKPAASSRFYGKGYIAADQTFYEMQTQYFDQILQDWRWRLTDDPAHEAKLRRGVELHLERLRECYDPDGNGTYESVINTWPTDCIWFNGGGCPDATAYAHRAHEFARDLAKRAGDPAAAARHQSRMDEIKAALFRELWVAEAGHPGLFREQGGHRRLVNNPWLYSLCIPIEAGMLTPEQAATTLHNAEYNLENLLPASGGRRVVTSNLTPAIWSVRVLWPGDNFMLAHAYFRTGLAREGWDVLRGNILHTGFNDLVPGDSVDLVGGTDFGDTVHAFTRTLVEGLFGYQPDFPFGKALIAPQFPADWDKASIRTPALSLDFRRLGTTHQLSVRLQRSTALDVELPVRTTAITQVTVNGRSADYQTRAGFGATIVRIPAHASAGEPLEIAITTANNLPEPAPVSVKGIAGTPAQLMPAGDPPASLVSFRDPLGALKDASIQGNLIAGTFSHNTGHRRVFATVKTGTLEQIRLFNLLIEPPPAAAPTTLAEVPANATWKPVDMSATLSADITRIYEQKYLSPRPPTVSTRIGTDGYSPWCFPHWGVSRPKIGTDRVPAMLDPADPSRLLTPQGVPFLWGGAAKNVAFTSLWDNWPDHVTVPVQQSADAAWFLVCGSTTVIQGRIANAVLHLKYADGVSESLELIPPFNYWNLSPIKGIQARAQFGASDYTEKSESFTVPKPWPMTVDLGQNCRAMLLNRKLRPGVKLESITLEALSQESVIGLMGVTLMNPR